MEKGEAKELVVGMAVLEVSREEVLTKVVEALEERVWLDNEELRKENVALRERIEELTRKEE